jgi:hypothetical protein
MGSREVEYWGEVVSEPGTGNYLLFWVVLVILWSVAIALFLMVLTTDLGWMIMALLAIMMLAMSFGSPLLSMVVSTEPDVKVYENGVVLFYPLRNPRFYGWDRFKGYAFRDDGTWPTERGWRMVLFTRKEGRRLLDPSSVPLGKDLEDHKAAWEHVSSQLKDLD